MGDPTPRGQNGDARTFRGILSRLRSLEQARPLQNAFNDASAAQSSAQTAQGTAESAQTTASGALGVAQGASYDATAAQAQAQAAQQTAAAALPKWSASDPDDTANPGGSDGAVWYTTNGTGGAALRQFRWNAATSHWTLTPIDGAALQNVIADTVRAGAVDGLLITGARIRSSADNLRVEMQGTAVTAYDSNGTASGSLLGGTVSGRSAMFLQGASNSLGFFPTLFVGASIFSYTDALGVARTVRHGFRVDQSLVLDQEADLFLPEWSYINDATSQTPAVGSFRPGGSGTTLLRRIAAHYLSLLVPGTETLKTVATATADGKTAVTADSATLTGVAKAADFQTTDGTSIVPSDTGWIALTAASGLTATGFAYRIKGGRVELSGTIKINSGSFPNGYTTLGTMPAGARPLNYMRPPIGMFNGYTALLVINTNGALQIGASSDRSADTVYLGGVSYPADR